MRDRYRRVPRPAVLISGNQNLDEQEAQAVAEEAVEAADDAASWVGSESLTDEVAGDEDAVALARWAPTKSLRMLRPRKLRRPPRTPTMWLKRTKPLMRRRRPMRQPMSSRRLRPKLMAQVVVSQRSALSVLYLR